MLKQDELFLRRAFHKSLVPCILSNLGGNINILVDGILVGQRIGTDGLSAISLCLPVYLFLCIVGSFIVSGTAIEASKAIGKNNPEKSDEFYYTAVCASFAASAVITVLGVLIIEPLSRVLCPDALIQPYVYDYALITLIGTLPKILIYIPFWFLRLDGRAHLVTLTMLIMGVGNAILDVIFLYPLDMGIEGAAWASVIATALACIFGFICLGDKKSSFHMGKSIIRNRSELKAIAVSGSPSALNNLFQTLRVLAVNSILLWAGGSSLVAAFTAVNCIFAFSLAIVDGVPQTASAMLGICSGERDNDSAVILIRCEMKTGLLLTLIFSAAAIGLSGMIASLYGLHTSLLGAMTCLSIGMFPGLWLSVLSGYYNVSGHSGAANLIIFGRVFAFAALSLLAAVLLGLSPWLFLIFSEILTLAFWFASAMIFHRYNPIFSRFLLQDRMLENEGKVYNFSVGGTVEEACTASELLTDFCASVGMGAKDGMKLGLALEEIINIIIEENRDGSAVRFDVRLFSIHRVVGIRIRYNGKEFNPLSLKDADPDDERLLGLEMVSGLTEYMMYQRTFGVNTLQILL